MSICGKKGKKGKKVPPAPRAIPIGDTNFRHKRPGHSGYQLRSQTGGQLKWQPWRVYSGGYADAFSTCGRYRIVRLDSLLGVELTPITQHRPRRIYFAVIEESRDGLWVGMSATGAITACEKHVAASATNPSRRGRLIHRGATALMN
jgi:hypothetical protein